MSKSNEFQDRWLDEMGGESLEGSGFEAEMPNGVYSNHHPPVGLHSANEYKEPSDVY
jgi:hypothetical protein